MARFVIIARDNPETFSHYSPQEMQAILERYMAWGERLASRGHMELGEKLTDGVGRVLGPGQSPTDGPYAEAKEIVGGFWIVSARDLEEAESLASDCPHLEFGTLEVRPVEEMNDA